jgi:hypothetical protein
MLSEKEKLFLKKLRDSNIDFMIVGLSAAVLQNAPVVTKDVDLWFRELDDQKMEECCKTVGGFFLPTNLSFQMPARFGGEALENLDVVISVDGIGSFQEEYAHALNLKLTDDLVVKVLPLDKIIASKEFIRREKDLIVLPALKSALAVQKK